MEELEDFDPYDSPYLFCEQIKQSGFAFREILRVAKHVRSGDSWRD